MGKAARGHHYVPQFYLRRFSASRSKDSKLAVVSLDERRLFETSTINIAVQRDFNRIDLPGIEIDALEKSLHPLENQLVRVLSEMEFSREFPSDPDDYAALMYFVSMLHVRNSGNREDLVAKNTEMINTMGRSFVATKEKWQAALEDLKQNGIEIPEGISFDQVQRFVERDEFEITYKHGHHATLEFQVVKDLLPHFWKRRWLLMLSDDDMAPFITSDRPISVNSEALSPGQFGLGTMQTFVIAPLSTTMALLGDYESNENRTETVDQSRVAEINRWTIESAYRQIFAPSMNFQFMRRGDLLSGTDLID